MQVFREHAHLRLTFSLAEGSLLRAVLNSVRAHYQIKPADLDPKTAAAWYSTRGCQSAGMNPAETREWLEHLFQYRGETLEALTSWIEQLTPRKEKHCRLNVPLEEAPAFLRVVNDHRLLLAARHDLGEAEMSLNYAKASAQLSAPQEAALLQIHFLAYLIESLLAHLPNGGADWGDLCLDPEMD